jgi:translation initiation factor 2A
VRIYQYPNIQTPIASKSFFKADTVDLMWNSTGTHLLVHTHVAVDASNKSYYGENHLYYMSIKGDGVMVQLGVLCAGVAEAFAQKALG